MIDCLQDNELSIVSSLRPRHPSQLITYLEISNSPPPHTSPTLDTYAVLDHILCRTAQDIFPLHQIHSISATPVVSSPFVLATKLQLPYFTHPRPPPTPPKRDLLPEHKLKYQERSLKSFLSPFHIFIGELAPAPKVRTPRSKWKTDPVMTLCFPTLSKLRRFTLGKGCLYNKAY